MLGLNRKRHAYIALALELKNINQEMVKHVILDPVKTTLKRKIPSSKVVISNGFVHLNFQIWLNLLDKI